MLTKEMSRILLMLLVGAFTLVSGDAVLHEDSSFDSLTSGARSLYNCEYYQWDYYNNEKDYEECKRQ